MMEFSDGKAADVPERSCFIWKNIDFSFLEGINFENAPSQVLYLVWNAMDTGIILNISPFFSHVALHVMSLDEFRLYIIPATTNFLHFLFFKCRDTF